jgi:hypothetical protein
MKNLTFTLTFTGLISPNGGDSEANDIAMTEATLRANPEQVVKNALSNGVVTEDSPATLDGHDFTITIGEEKSETDTAAPRHDPFIQKLDSFSAPVTPENFKHIEDTFDCADGFQGDSGEILVDTNILEPEDLEQIARWLNLTVPCVTEKHILVYRRSA